MQGKAEILWKYNYYAVVYEHFDKPYFGVLGTIIQIIRMTRCVRSCTESGCCRFCSSKVGSDFSECKTVCISIFFSFVCEGKHPHACLFAQEHYSCLIAVFLSYTKCDLSGFAWWTSSVHQRTCFIQNMRFQEYVFIFMERWLHKARGLRDNALAKYAAAP